MSGGWYVSKQNKGSVAYRVIRVGVFALIVVVFLVGCNQGDPTATPEPTPSPTECPPDMIPVPTETPISPTITPVPVMDTLTPTTPPVLCIVSVNQDKKGYAYPAPARTERFGGDPTSESFAELPAEQHSELFTTGQYLRLDQKYNRNNYEHLVFRVAEVSNDNGSTWETITPAWISTHSNLQSVDTSGCDSLPDSNPSRNILFEDTRENLRDYGVDVQNRSGIWDYGELQAVLQGVQRINLAFSLLINSEGLGSSQDTPQLFRNVMIPSTYPDFVLFLREDSSVTSSFVNCLYTDGPPVSLSCGFMQSSNDGTSWSPGGKVKVETVIHELGHVFDNRLPKTNPNTGNPDTELRYSIDQSGFSLTDTCSASPLLIMGNSLSGWTRGDIGWGSAAKDLSRPPVEQDNSQFQQNPQNTDYETVADMFLNWAYRRTTGGDFKGDPCLAPQDRTWEGFKNINEIGASYSSQGSPRRPGNFRYEWMDNEMTRLFDSKSSWR